MMGGQSDGEGDHDTRYTEQIYSGPDQQQGKAVSDIPCAVGFGIATPQQAQEMASCSDGAIVGSAIVKIVAKYGKECIKPVCDYVQEMKDAVLSA